jgi:hypothetical protein
MKTPILIAAIFFSGLSFAQQKKGYCKNKNIEAVTLKNRFSKNKATVLYMMLLHLHCKRKYDFRSFETDSFCLQQMIKH